MNIRAFLVSFVLSTVYCPTDAQSQWKISSCGDRPVAFALIGSTLYECGGGLLRSTDQGWTWGPIPGSIANDCSSMVAVGNNLFIGTWNGAVYHSTTGGSSWKPGETGPGCFEVLSLAACDSNVFASTTDGLFRTANLGMTWERLSEYNEIRTAFASGSRIFATSAQNKPYPQLMFSGDAGVTFSSLDSTEPFFSSKVDAYGTFATLGKTILLHGFSWTSSGTLFRSTDSGVHWDSPSIMGGNSLCFASDAGVLFCASASGKVYRSTDTGSSWQDITFNVNGFSKKGIYALTVAGTHLITGGEGGVWRLDLRDTALFRVVGDVEERSSVASVGVFPNPLSRTASINFACSDFGFTLVSIHNLLGTEISRLFSGELTEGEHSFTWDAHGLPPGMYACVVRMNGRVEQVPVILER